MRTLFKYLVFWPVCLLWAACNRAVIVPTPYQGVTFIRMRNDWEYETDYLNQCHATVADPRPGARPEGVFPCTRRKKHKGKHRSSGSRLPDGFRICAEWE